MSSRALVSLFSGGARLCGIESGIAFRGLAVNNPALRSIPLATTARLHSTRTQGRRLVRQLINQTTKHRVVFYFEWALVSSGGERRKLSLYGRVKQLIKDYWYIALPVHFANEAVWFAVIYAAIAGGADVVSWMEWAGLPSSFVEKIRNSPSLGNLALALLVYKIVSPPRYMMTVGLTGFAIRLCARKGLITSSQAVNQARGYAFRRRAHYATRYRETKQDWRSAWHRQRERLKENWEKRVRGK